MEATGRPALYVCSVLFILTGECLCGIVSTSYPCCVVLCCVLSSGSSCCGCLVCLVGTGEAEVRVEEVFQ